MHIKYAHNISDSFPCANPPSTWDRASTMQKGVLLCAKNFKMSCPLVIFFAPCRISCVLRVLRCVVLHIVRCLLCVLCRVLCFVLNWGANLTPDTSTRRIHCKL